MTIAVQNPKTRILWDDSYALAAGQDMRENQGMAVNFTASVTTGEATVSAPTTTGGAIAGILKNPDAYPSGSTTIPEARAQVAKIGIVAVRSVAAFSAGAKLMVGDNYGRLGTASGSGNYVVAIAREAATAADQMIAAELISQYPLT